MAPVEVLPRAPTEWLNAIDLSMIERGNQYLKEKVQQRDVKDTESIESELIQTLAMLSDSSLMSLAFATRTANPIQETTHILGITSTPLMSAAANLPTAIAYLTITTVDVVSSTQSPSLRLKGAVVGSSQASSMILPTTKKLTPTSMRGAAGTNVANPSIQAVPAGDPQHASLSPTAQHILIAVGTLGAAIIITFLIFFVLRLCKVSVQVPWRRNFWPSHRLDDSKDERSAFARMPPEGMGFLRPQNIIDSRPHHPRPVSSKMLTFSGLKQSQPESQPRAARRKHSPTPLVLRQTLPRLASDQSMPASRPIKSADIASDSSQCLQIPNTRMSDMSSLSSGFGDAIIGIPELAFTTQAGPIHAPKPPVHDNLSSRATVPKTPKEPKENPTYNHTLEDSPPRFWSVNSWVNQQSSRLQRHTDRQSRRQSAKTTKRERAISEATNPAFKAHPGDAVRAFGKGQRVPSEILDRKFSD